MYERVRVKQMKQILLMLVLMILTGCKQATGRVVQCFMWKNSAQLELMFGLVELEYRLEM